jgi:hypothetical protein
MPGHRERTKIKLIYLSRSQKTFFNFPCGDVVHNIAMQDCAERSKVLHFNMLAGTGLIIHNKSNVLAEGRAIPLTGDQIETLRKEVGSVIIREVGSDGVVKFTRPTAEEIDEFIAAEDEAKGLVEVKRRLRLQIESKIKAPKVISPSQSMDDWTQSVSIDAPAHSLYPPNSCVANRGIDQILAGRCRRGRNASHLPPACLHRNTHRRGQRHRGIQRAGDAAEGAASARYEPR